MATRNGQVLLSREAWARAVLRTITEGGPDAVSIDRLASELGVTRGSFYWHFPDKAEAIQAALELWAWESTEAQLPQLEAIAEPVKRLRALFRAVYEPAVDAAELALAAAGDDPVVAPIFARVTRRRMDVLRRIFTELGLTTTEARDRAWLAYALYLGHHQLRRNSELAALQPERIDQMVNVLTAGAPRARRPARRGVARAR